MIVAVDPGKVGGLAWIDDDSGRPRVARLALNPADFKTQLVLLPGTVSGKPLDRRCYLETVGGFVAGRPLPGSAMFNFGRAFGMIEGVLAALEIQIVKVRPQQWQQALGCKRRPAEARNAYKRRLRTLALELYPALVSHITLQTADALLILHCAKEKLL